MNKLADLTAERSGEFVARQLEATLADVTRTLAQLKDEPARPHVTLLEARQAQLRAEIAEQHTVARAARQEAARARAREVATEMAGAARRLLELNAELSALHRTAGRGAIAPLPTAWLKGFIDRVS